MTKTIKCTNPSCESLIPVPEGAMQVICPTCNTWHFPSPEEAKSDYPEPSTNNAYGLPPVLENPALNEQMDMPPPPPITDPYQQQAPPANEQHKISDTPANDRSTALGYLITNTGERMRLKEGKNIIGRKGTDLIIDDRTVSRKHCVIEISPNNAGHWEYTIFDIGHIEGSPSTNGVFVSGRSLRLQDYERIPIRNGTSLRIGMVELVLQY